MSHTTTPCNLEQLELWLFDQQGMHKGATTSLISPLEKSSPDPMPPSYPCRITSSKLFTNLQNVNMRILNSSLTLDTTQKKTPASQQRDHQRNLATTPPQTMTTIPTMDGSKIIRKQGPPQRIQYRKITYRSATMRQWTTINLCCRKNRNQTKTHQKKIKKKTTQCNKMNRRNRNTSITNNRPNSTSKWTRSMAHGRDDTHYAQENNKVMHIYTTPWLNHRPQQNK